MNKSQAQKFIGTTVDAWTACNGQYVGVLEEVLTPQGRPWRGKVRITGVLKPADMFDKNVVDRRGFREGEIIEVGGTSISPTDKVGTTYLDALRFTLAQDQARLTGNNPVFEEYRWIHEGRVKAFGLGVEAEERRLAGGQWKIVDPDRPAFSSRPSISP